MNKIIAKLRSFNPDRLTLYTIGYLICTIFLLKIFGENGKTFIWSSDGLLQHFTAYNHLCDFVAGIFKDGRDDGLYSYYIGQGGDLIQTLGCYSFTDPVNWFTVMIFFKFPVTGYCASILIKLYLTGAAYLLYSHVCGYKSKSAAVAGALAYTYSTAVLFTGLRHPIHLCGMYCLPLLIAGAEDYDRRHGRTIMILATVLSVLSSVYMFYMNALLTIVYYVVKVLTTHSDSLRIHIAAALRRMIGIAGLVIIGCLISAGTLLPMLSYFMNSARSDYGCGNVISSLKYSEDFGTKFWEYLFSGYGSAGYYTMVGINAIAIVLVLVHFIKKETSLNIKVYLVISFIGVFIPYVGRVLNKFSYATNRWSYIICFLVSVMITEALPLLRDITKRERLIVYLIASTYLLLCFLDSTYSNIQRNSSLYMLIYVLVMVWILLEIKPKYTYRYLLLITMAGCIFHIYFMYEPDNSSYLKEFKSSESVYDQLDINQSVAAEPTLQSDSIIRTESSSYTANTGLYSSTYGTNMYWSTIPYRYTDYYRSLGLLSYYSSSHYRGLDARPGLLALAAVKYYTCNTDDLDATVPYGYSELGTTSDEYLLYENTMSLPIGYTYSSYMSRDMWNNLDSVSREFSMLSSCVVDDDSASSLEGKLDKLSGSTIFDTYAGIEEVDFILSGTKKATSRGLTADKRSDCSISFKSNGSIELSADIPENCTVYLCIDDLSLYKEYNDSGLAKVQSIPLYCTREYDETTVKKYTNLSNDAYTWYVERDDIIYNLGYGGSGENTFTLSCSRECNISFSDIHIIAIPMDNYENCIDSLKEYSLKNISVTKDCITGSISVPDTRLLQISVPYSEGWTAYVDGEKTEILCTDLMYMGIVIDEGSHEICLRYSTPYLRTGIILSLFTIILLVGYVLLSAKGNTDENSVDDKSEEVAL